MAVLEKGLIWALSTDALHNFLLIFSENSSEVPRPFSLPPVRLLLCSAREVLQYCSHEGLIFQSLLM